MDATSEGLTGAGWSTQVWETKTDKPNHVENVLMLSKTRDLFAERASGEPNNNNLINRYDITEVFMNYSQNSRYVGSNTVIK